MSRPGKGNKAPIFSCSPLRPALSSQGSGRLQFRFFPQPLGFQHNFQSRHRQPRGGRWDWRERATAGHAGRAREALGSLLGHAAASLWSPPGPLGSPWLVHTACPLELPSQSTGRCRLPSDKKDCVPRSRVPLPRPPQPCLSAGSQVITNPWRGAEAEHLPERHGDDE